MPQQLSIKSAVYRGHSAAEDAATLCASSELVKKFLFDVLDRPRLMRIAQQNRVDFAGGEPTSLLVCHILRLAGFSESEIVPKKDVKPLHSFAQQREHNLF